MNNKIRILGSPTNVLTFTNTKYTNRVIESYNNRIVMLSILFRVTNITFNTYNSTITIGTVILY